MRFVYQYKTKENERREGELRAASREAVYTELKKQGIRPFKVDLAPGIFNHLAALGKRWLAIAVLCALLAAALAAKMGADRRAARSENEAHEAISAIDSPVRRQPIGDTAVIEKGIRTGWEDVFSEEGDRFLASFAIPGYSPTVRTTTVEALRKVLDSDSTGPQTAPDALEARQIRSMVAGMKRELRAFLSHGGSIQQYCRLLVQRQEEEIGYYNRAKTELETAEKNHVPAPELMSLWESKNASLRKMGIRLLPMPE